MSFLRVSNPVASPFNIYDLGVVIAASATNVVLSNQFSIQDLVRSADLEAAIIAGDLTVDIDYGTGFTAIAAVDYTNRDALGAFLNVYEITNENNNEKLVNGSDVTTLHMHDGRYFTETELSGTGGAALIGVNNSGWTHVTGSTVQAALNSIDALFSSAVTLDAAYDNDSDGILDVDGTTKPLNLRSDNANDVVISRWNTTDSQDGLRLDVSADRLLLGALASGALAQLDVRVLSNLIVDGNITFTGTITDTTVNEINVTNANIRLRDGAASGADANVFVERGSSGADASLKWNESALRWKAGLDGTEQTIALLEADEAVSGTWNFNPSPSTDPNFWMTERATPTTALGAAGQIPMAMMANGRLALYDKSSSRNKWLSVDRTRYQFTGRSNNNNSNEYAYVGLINSFETGIRIPYNMTLVGISAQTDGTETWTARVRKNDSATNLASLAITAAQGGQDNTLNLDLSAGDELQVYIDGTSVGSPTIILELAQRF